MKINWGGNVDELIVSWQKPVGTYLSVFTLCGLAIFVPDTRGEVIPLIAALAGVNGGLRTLEKVKGAAVPCPPGTASGGAGA